MRHSLASDSGTRVFRLLSLAPTPTFALLALLSAGQQSTLQSVVCSAAHTSPLTGTVSMYLLMGVFHSAPWIRMLTRAVTSQVRQCGPQRTDLHTRPGFAHAPVRQHIRERRAGKFRQLRSRNQWGRVYRGLPIARQKSRANDATVGEAADVFVHNLQTAATGRVDVSTDGVPAAGQGLEPLGLSMSGDGQWVAFQSDATNLVPDDRNGNTDAFVHHVLPHTLIRVNAGGSTFTHTFGRVWQSDRGFNTGIASSTTAGIANTNDPGLYQNQRYDAPGGPELRYEFPVPNGTHLVRLHLAENYEPNFHIGKRVFDVDMEGIRRFTNLDTFSLVGGQAARIREATVTVTDGKLDIDFHHKAGADNPQVNAIEIIQQ
jgi:hypothetical protein